MDKTFNNLYETESIIRDIWETEARLVIAVDSALLSGKSQADDIYKEWLQKKRNILKNLLNNLKLSEEKLHKIYPYKITIGLNGRS